MTIVPAEPSPDPSDVFCPASETKTTPGVGGFSQEILGALFVVTALSTLGIPLGLLWWTLAPKVEVAKFGQNAASFQMYPTGNQPEGPIANDGWLVAICALAGLIAAIVVWRVARRWRGPVLLLALAIGSLLGSIVAQWTGHRIGLEEFHRLTEQLPVGGTARQPVTVSSNTLTAVQAMVAVAVYTLLSALHDSPSLGREPECAGNPEYAGNEEEPPALDPLDKSDERHMPDNP